MSSIVLALVSVAFVAAGCTTALAPAPRLTQGEVARGCPLGVGGATVVAEDTPDGIALSFTSVERRPGQWIPSAAIAPQTKLAVP